VTHLTPQGSGELTCDILPLSSRVVRTQYIIGIQSYFLAIFFWQKNNRLVLTANEYFQMISVMTATEERQNRNQSYLAEFLDSPKDHVNPTQPWPS
jgi:hypothetical protein